MEFTIGQILTGTQPEYREAAVWANENNAHIVARDEGGFIITGNPPQEEAQEYGDEIDDTLIETAEK